jgi:magnesium transporter
MSTTKPRRLERFHRRTPPGASPGTLVADPRARPPRMTVFAYGPAETGELVERTIEDPEELRPLVGRGLVVWLNVDGLGDADKVLRIGEIFGLHRLALEDVLNTHQRPKVEPYGEHRFIVAKMVEWKDRLETDQLSLFLGQDFVVTFQEKPGDGFGNVRERLRAGRGLLRKSGPDYLAYALLDAVVDGYFPVLEVYGEGLEALEDRIVLELPRDCLLHIHETRRDLLTLRRAVWPLREAINQLLREADTPIQKETRLYLNDCYDHTVQIMDLVETYREVASGLMEVYLSSMGNRLNEVMKMLTIIATIFIPLTFVAGVYGMNFDPDSSPWNMPELRWFYGYPACLLVMAIIAGVLLFYFKRRGWLGAAARAPRVLGTSVQRRGDSESSPRAVPGHKEVSP